MPHQCCCLGGTCGGWFPEWRAGTVRGKLVPLGRVLKWVAACFWLGQRLRAGGRSKGWGFQEWMRRTGLC